MSSLEFRVSFPFKKSAEATQFMDAVLDLDSPLQPEPVDITKAGWSVSFHYPVDGENQLLVLKRSIRACWKNTLSKLVPEEMRVETEFTFHH